MEGRGERRGDEERGRRRGEERGRGEGSRGGAAAATAARQRRERAAGPWSCTRGAHMPHFAHVRAMSHTCKMGRAQGRATLIVSTVSLHVVDGSYLILCDA